MALKLEDRPESDYDDGKPAWRTNLEDTDLDDVRSLPEATDDDLPEGHPSRSKKSTPEELNDAEANPTDSASSSDEESNFFKDVDGDSRVARTKAVFTKSRLIVGGGAVGLIVAGSLGIMTIFSGPAQFVHIAQLLQRFHFQSLEDNGNSRVLKLYKYAKNVREGNAANARLGVVEKRVVTHLDDKFADIGVSKRYTGVTQQFAGWEIDPVKYSQSEAGKGLARNGDPEAVKAWLQEKVDGIGTVSIKENPGGNNTFLLEPESGFLGYKSLANHRLSKLMLADIGIEGVPAAVDARMMGKRDAVPWHPIQKLDTKIVGTIDAKFTAWWEEMKERISGKSEVNVDAHGSKQKNPQGEEVSTPGTDTGAEEIKKSASEAKKLAAGEGGKISAITGSTTFKVGSLGIAAVGLLCAVKGIAENADNVKRDMVVLPLIRTGMQAISVGNQVMSGKDIDAEQLGFFMKQLNDPKTGSWASARSIQAELGKEPTGKDIPDEANIKNISEGNFLTQLVNDIPGSGVICDAAGSFLGQTLQFAVSAFTPVATIVQTAFMASPAGEAMITAAVRWLAGSPIPTMVFGPDYGNYINYGARLASNDAAVSLGGAKLSSGDSAVLRERRQQVQQDEMKSRSFAQRVFDPYSPDSLAGKAIDAQSSSVNTNVANFFSSIINPSALISGFGKMFSRPVKAAAANSYAYGFPEIGFSFDDMNKSAYDDPYANADYAISIIRGNTKYKDRAKTCFGITLTDDGDVKSDLSASAKIDPLSKDYPDDCRDTSPDWTSIRFFILDTKTAEAADCFGSGDAQSCADVGFGAASGTTDAGKATSSNVYFLGDSLTVSMRDAGNLQTAAQGQGWSSTIMAECGRHLVSDGANCSSQPIFGGIHQVDQPADRAAIKSAGVVVIGLGTNDPGMTSFAKDAKDLVSKIKTLNPSVKIYWINLFSTDEKNATYQTMNTQLAGAAGEAGFSVIDWAAQAPKVSAYPPGQYHPSNYQAMTDFVISQLGHAP